MKQTIKVETLPPRFTAISMYIVRVARFLLLRVINLANLNPIDKPLTTLILLFSGCTDLSAPSTRKYCLTRSVNGWMTIVVSAGTIAG